MTLLELGLCLSSLMSSSTAQLFIKAAVFARSWWLRLIWFGLAGSLLLLSVVLAVIALRTLPLTQLVPFAAGAYFLVPLGCRCFFGESLNSRFWFGLSIIVSGVLCVLI